MSAGAHQMFVRAFVWSSPNCSCQSPRNRGNVGALTNTTILLETIEGQRSQADHCVSFFLNPAKLSQLVMNDQQRAEFMPNIFLILLVSSAMFSGQAQIDAHA